MKRLSLEAASQRPRFCDMPWLQFLAALLLFSCGLIHAQVDVSGTLLGAVTDPSGAVVPGVRITAQNSQTGLIMITTSDERGNYLFASLPRGSYRIKCESAGFQMFAASGIAVQSQQVVTLPIALQVGAATESVEVSAAATIVDVTNSTIKTTYDEKLMGALPVWGRDARQTMELLMPGAVAAGTGLSYNVPITSFNGVSGLTNNYRLRKAARIRGTYFQAGSRGHAVRLAGAPS